MSLRAQVLRGGSYLAFRQAGGMILSLVGSVLVARALGPRDYGLFAGTFGIYSYVWLLSQWGINVYLIRREGEPPAEEYHQGFTLLLLLGLVGAGLGLASLPLLRQWLGVDGVLAVGVALFAALPVHLTNLIPLARLERAMDYRRVAWMELVAQVAYYAAALPLAYLGMGVWTLVAGFWMQILINTGLLYYFTGYRPRWFYRRESAAVMLRYGVSYASATWLWQLRTLVNPLVVGRWLGTEAVGCVALAIRLVDTLSFVRNATWRIALAALAKLQSDRRKLAQAISQGMWLQLMALGPLLVVMAWLAPWVVPVCFGDRWRPAVELYPFIAVGCLINAGFNMQASTLAVLGQNWRASGIAAGLVVLFSLGAAVAVPRWGLIGYGVAELGALPVYVFYHFALRREVPGVSYSRILVWWMAFGVGMFTSRLGWWVAPLPLLIFLSKDTWRKLGEVWVALRSRQLPVG